MKILSGNVVIGLACLVLLGLERNAHGADRDYLEDSDFTKTVTINFNGTSATVTNLAGVTVTTGANSSYLSITSSIEGVEYVLSGTSSDGYVQITSSYPSKVTLNGVSLTSSNGPPLSMLSAARNFVVLAEGTNNSLTDSNTYTRTGSGTLYGSGPLILSGKGSLTVAGIKSHAIYSGSYIRALGGDVLVTAAAKDALHSKSFQMDEGSITATATGDGIDADTGTIVMNAGSVKVSCPADDTKGMGCDGLITINGGTINMTVNGAQAKGLSNKADMAINGGSIILNLAGAVYLKPVTSGTTTYYDPAYCTGIKSGANLTIGGESRVTITHTGTAGKGISADGNIIINNGVLDLATSGGPSASYTNSAGVTDVASADCLTTDGTLTINGGNITALSTGASGDCLSSDLATSITGGTLTVTGKGAKSKGLKSDSDLTISGGTLVFAMSGAVVLETIATNRYDPAYCTAIKCGTNLAISNGTFTITHSGQAGKGISADGNINITGGTFNLTTSGAATATFTNSSGVTDIAAADCLKADGTLTITGGNITATSTGTAGDAISCDGAAIIGVAGISSTPVISANTTGAHVLISGSGMNADYSNAKAFSAGGNLTVNGGIFRASTQTDGGEGLESKANMVINDGLIEITSYDDAINAGTSLTVNGGNIYCYSSGNDGMDSNGTFRFTGGTIITSGTNAPEEGFDCDNNNFAINGGVLVGTGGATSTPTAASSAQRSVIYKGAGAANNILQVKNTTTGATVLVYKLPRTYSGGGGGGGGGSAAMSMLFSNANLAAGSYAIYSGVTVSGGTDFHGYYTGATVSGGTQIKTFTISATVTTVQ